MYIKISPKNKKGFMNNTRDNKTYKELREEWANSLTRVMASRTLGQVCFNCGCSECIELHHIVPLEFGGTNNISNIAVLCHKCHMAIHNGKSRKIYHNVKVGGRPHNVTSEELEDALEDFISGHIGTNECKKRMGMSTKSKIGDMKYYKDFLKKKGIKHFRNNIDIIRNKRGDVSEGDKVGTIIYISGDVENIYFEI